MTRAPILFALANPDPDPDPDDIADLAAVIATGRSNYPNQVNNALVFPGLFRGVLGSQSTTLDGGVFLAAARALAGLTSPPSATRLLPDVFDPRVVPTVAAAVQGAIASPSPAQPDFGSQGQATQAATPADQQPHHPSTGEDRHG